MSSVTKLKITLGFVGFLLLLAVGGLAFGPAKNQGFAPVQPIPFSHKKHAGFGGKENGQYGIDCRYCHYSVEKSRHATVPAVNVCMNCHSLVKTESPYIAQIQESYKTGKPIPWVKVHDLPDFTYFNHRRHVAKGVKCQTCHGDVQEMERVKQFAPLTMGWCVNCHRKPEYNAPISCDTCHR